MSWSLTFCQGLCSLPGVIEYDLADPELGGSQIAAVALLQEFLIQPFLDGAKYLSLADVKELGHLQLGLAAPGVVRSVRELVDAVDDSIGCQRQGKLLPHRMMDDREARLEPKRLFRKIAADVCLSAKTFHSPIIPDGTRLQNPSYPHHDLSSPRYRRLAREGVLLSWP